MSTSTTVENKFDYIICGGGCAGISLLLQLLQQHFVEKKKILILEKSPQTKNDKTWCYWENDLAFFEHIVHHKWDELGFHSQNIDLDLQIEPYTYKMIRSIDFYKYAKNMILTRSLIEWRVEEVVNVGTNDEYGFVHTHNNTYYAEYVFNSILFEKDHANFAKSNAYKLNQHFKGWVIETESPVFNQNKATFMDFRVDQTMGTTFVYVLPTSPTRALVEYTFFNDELLDNKAYDVLLKAYLSNYWNLTTNYTIIEEEYGVIPMTNYKFNTHNGRVINIGTAGGWTKATSGFTFSFTQRKVKEIVSYLENGKLPVPKKSLFKSRFKLYDSILLNVLKYKKMEGSEIFHLLFTKIKANIVFSFLDDDSTLKDELKILSSMPTSIFLPAALQEIFKRK